MAFGLSRFRFAATLLALTSLAACSSSKDDPTPAADAPGMSWTVDGNNVTAIQTTKTLTASEIQLTGAVGSATSASQVSLTIPRKAGTYTLSSTSDADATYVAGNSTSGAYYAATTGTINVTTLTATNVSGTFTFTGTDALGGTTTTKAITNGKFNIAL